MHLRGWNSPQRAPKWGAGLELWRSGRGELCLRLNGKEPGVNSAWSVVLLPADSTSPSKGQCSLPGSVCILSGAPHLVMPREGVIKAGRELGGTWGE